MGALLKQSAPVAGSAKTLFTVTDERTELYFIQVCNTGGAADSFCIMVCPGNSAATTANYHWKDQVIPPGEAFTAYWHNTFPLRLPKGSTIRVKSSGGQVAFNLHGWV